MTEDEYINATNLQKMRVVNDLIRDMSPSTGLSEDRIKSFKTIVSLSLDDLFASVKLDESFIPHPIGVVRQGDEHFCPKCGKRWGVDEGDPGCSA